MRSILFTFYGLIVGVVYAAFVWNALRSPWVAGAVGALLILLCGFQGWNVSRVKENPAGGRFFAVAATPFVVVIGLFAIGIFLFFAFCCWPFLAVATAHREARVRQELKKQGRFVTLDVLRPKLAAGEGTLLEETGPKGPYRIWWTQDDLLPLPADVNDSERLRRVFSGIEDEFNDRCLRDYISKQDGRATLTTIPPKLARSGRLGDLFPKARRVTVVHLTDEDGTI